MTHCVRRSSSKAAQEELPPASEHSLSAASQVWQRASLMGVAAVFHWYRHILWLHHTPLHTEMRLVNHPNPTNDIYLMGVVLNHPSTTCSPQCPTDVVLVSAFGAKPFLVRIEYRLRLSSNIAPFQRWVFLCTSIEIICLCTLYSPSSLITRIPFNLPVVATNVPTIYLVSR